MTRPRAGPSQAGEPQDGELQPSPPSQGQAGVGPLGAQRGEPAQDVAGPLGESGAGTPGQDSMGQDPTSVAASADAIQRAGAPALAARQRGLCAAAHALGRDLEPLLALLPESERFLPPAQVPHLDDLLWQELEGLEQRGVSARDAHGRGRVQYFLRRRELVQRRRWEVVGTRLPRTWRRLAEQPAGAVRERCIELGVRLVAAAGRGQPSAELKRWLRPLGGPLARRVAERLVADAAAPADPLAEQAHSAYAALRDGARRESSILSRLGRRLLAALFADVPEELRHEAVSIGRSNILEILDAEQPLALSTPAERERAEELLRAVLDPERARP